MRKFMKSNAFTCVVCGISSLLIAACLCLISICMEPTEVPAVTMEWEPIPESFIEKDVFAKYADFTSNFNTLCNELDAFGIWYRHSYVQGEDVVEDVVAETYYNNINKVNFCLTRKPGNTVKTWVDLVANKYYSNCNDMGWAVIEPVISTSDAQTHCESYLCSKTNINTMQNIFDQCTEDNLVKAFNESGICTLQFELPDFREDIYSMTTVTVVFDNTNPDADLVICNIKGDWKDNTNGVDQDIYSYVVRNVAEFDGVIPENIMNNTVSTKTYINAFN